MVGTENIIITSDTEFIQQVNNSKECDTLDYITERQDPKSYQLFIDFLNKRKANKNSDYTHTSFQGGKYFIEDTEYDVYLNLYTNNIGKKKSMTEKVCMNRYIRFDLDLHFKNSMIELTKKNILEITDIFTTEINKYYNTNYNLYVLTRDEPVMAKNDIWKNGIHIQIPDIITKKDHISKIIRNELISNKQLINIFNKMEVINPITDIIDNSIYNDTSLWIQYGGDKIQDYSNAYTVKHIVDKNNNYDSSKNYESDYIKLFSLRNKKGLELTPTNDIANINIEKIKNEDNEIEREKLLIERQKKEKKDNIEWNKVVDNDFIKELVSILNPERAIDYKTWSELCWCLKSIDEGTFKLFDAFSKLCEDKYDENNVEKFWDNATQGSYTMGTLRFWAKQDNPEKYDEICEKYRKYNMEDFNFKGGITHFSLAEVFVNEYTDKYIFNKNEIFVYHNDIWDNSLSEALIQDDLVKMIGKLCKIATRTQDKEDLSDIFKKFSSITTRNNRDKIVKDIKDKLLIKNNHNILINYTLDQKRNIHFRNGVLEMEKYNPETNNIMECFRPRKKTDYVSGYNDYDFNIDVCKEKIDKVKKIYRQIQPNKQNFNYYLTFLAYCLTGDTKYQKCEIGVGYSASNGKSTHTEIHQISMPFYTMKLDKKTFNEGNSKNHKQFIELFNKPVRLSYMEELKTDKLDAELFKEYVDGKNLNVEVLYGSCKIHPIQAKLKTSSNFDLDIQNDKGVIRRGLKLNYQSRFVDDEELVNEDKHIYLADEDLIEKFEIDDDLKSAYIIMLLPYVSNYIKNGLVIPKKIKNAFKEMVEEYDDIGLLINNSDTFEKVSPSELDCKDRLSKNELLNIFKNNGIKVNWKQLLGQMKGYGYIWNRNQRNQDKGKGCFENLKYNEETIDESDEL